MACNGVCQVCHSSVQVQEELRHQLILFAVICFISLCHNSIFLFIFNFSPGEKNQQQQRNRKDPESWLSLKCKGKPPMMQEIKSLEVYYQNLAHFWSLYCSFEKKKNNNIGCWLGKWQQNFVFGPCSRCCCCHFFTFYFSAPSNSYINFCLK